MIYENHFALTQRPFTIAPNPDFLYAHGQYQEALAALEFGMLHRGGFVLLTGEVGTGKTTLCKHLLKQIPSNTEVALILHPQLDRIELLQGICKEFGIDFSHLKNESQLIEAITEFLLGVYSRGGYSVLIIDEAQHLDASVLELVRLLTNLETHEDKLLQIILLGQPELQQRLSQYSLRQLNQRFTARYHLKPLSLYQVRDYVAHRLQVAGTEKRLFSPAGLMALYRYSKGIPRLINLIADRALMGAYSKNRYSVGPVMIQKAANEVLGGQVSGSSFKGSSIVKPLSSLIVLAVALFVFYQPVSQWVSGFSMSGGQVTCNEENACWQGRVPASLVDYGDGFIQAYFNGKWSSPYEVTATRGLVLSRVSFKDQLMELQQLQSAIKIGEIHSLVPWVASVLDGYSVAGSNSDDFSQWQLIRPNQSLGSTSSGNEYYDLLLEDKVKAFQKDYGLVVDGIIGRQTLVALKLFELKNKGVR